MKRFFLSSSARAGTFANTISSSSSSISSRSGLSHVQRSAGRLTPFSRQPQSPFFHLQIARSSSSKASEPQPQSDGEAAAGGEAAAAAADGSGNAQKEKETEQQQLVSKLQREVKDLKDQLVRSYAEEENVRRIAKKDVENARQYGNTSFAKHMLDVADNLERALEAVPKETRDELKQGKGDKHLKTLVDGIEMTEKGLQKAFQANGLVKYGVVGDAFDPAQHDALFQAPAAAGQAAGTIAQVLKAGYKLKGRVIRPAQVGTVAA